MSVLVSGQPQTAYAKLSDNTLTTVFTAAKRTTIVGMAFTETQGGTPTLTVQRNNAAGTVYYFRNALAVTAKQRLLFDEVFSLDQGDTIKAQSNDGTGDFDVMITYLAPSALSNS